jgi:hypothetical protein
MAESSAALSPLDTGTGAHPNASVAGFLVIPLQLSRTPWGLSEDDNGQCSQCFSIFSLTIWMKPWPSLLCQDPNPRRDENVCTPDQQATAMSMSFWLNLRLYCQVPGHFL